MQAGTAAVSSAGSPFDTNGATLLQQPPQRQQHQQRRLSHRSTSLSSGSVVTIGRSHSRVRSHSPGNDGTLMPLRLARDSMSHEHRRRKSVAIDPSEHRVGNDNTVDRWSHSTSSSVASSTRRNRSSSGAVLSSIVGQSFSPRHKPLTALDRSPRASPPRRHVRNHSQSYTGSPTRHSRRSSKAGNLAPSLTALPPLHTTPALTDPNDTESPSTTQTIPTPSIHSSYVPNEYFQGADVYNPYGMAKTQRITMARNQFAPMSVPNASRAVGSESQEAMKHAHPSTSRNDHDRKAKTAGESSIRPRTRERTEKDKKTMLSKALQKANTAVLLDNAQNYEGALEAYNDACDLLTQVMERTSGEDDKHKLDAIRVTYSNRMGELRQLVQEMPATSDEKNLPARPMSADSVSLKSPRAGSISPIDGAVESSRPETQYVRSSENVPRLSYTRNDRDSFFERTMRAVETSFESDTQTDTTESTLARPEDELPEERHTRRPSVHLSPPEHTEYMPRPLSPRRPPSPQMQAQAEEAWQQQPEPAQDDEREPVRDRADSKDSTSWLDTIDESGTSCSDSVHSLDEQGMHRKHIRGTSGGTDPDFDAAFDAAVEAAYDEGLEPDLEARRKRLTALRRAQNDSVQVPASEINEILPGSFESRSALSLDPDDEEEERILDELTNDYGSGFNFELQSKSALPRQSDSSGYSRSTWQSSQLSDRATNATSLSTVAEDTPGGRSSKPTGPMATRARGESAALPPPSAPPTGALPPPPGAGTNRLSGVRSRRLSGMNQKQLKIETSPQAPQARKRASTFHHSTSPFAEDEEETHALGKDRYGERLEPTPSDTHHDNILKSPPSLEFHSAFDGISKPPDEPTIDYRPSYEEVPSDLSAPRPTLFRKNKSSISLREHAGHTLLQASPDLEPPMATPMSSTFMSFAAAKRNQNPLTSQRANFPAFGPSLVDGQQPGGGVYLFDTSLSVAQTPVSPRSPRSPNLTPMPLGLEPCPEPFLLRPFWLMRALSQTIIHPRGGFLTTKVFIPRKVWQTRGVKLKLLEDKIANCDLLTAALGRLAGVDTYDADAVMDELQSFEEVMERVQTVLAKKLGSDVGVHGVTGMFKDATASGANSATGSGAENAPADKSAKSNSGKSYLTSWRKLRNKSSGAPLSGSSQPASAKPTAEREQHSMPSVPMTSYVPVERRGSKKEARNTAFEGPYQEYMGSLARLFDGIQVLDQIARQVEDPGLKHSSPTHVGLELSIRHAAEFFGFYVCRFVLADLGLLMDKFLKRGTEWVLA
ncbi:Hypothetical predicted protein [Lecanosticta acicola]|uniref:MIT domain-containing protein n=1 Tax=Lecanosticta acicola TaxID=111012 RepID=A0AAI8Z4A4_9PEZI|nr:Hypothetical predicted protein [Lecanosticta acicola]